MSDISPLAQLWQFSIFSPVVCITRRGETADPTVAASEAAWNTSLLPVRRAKKSGSVQKRMEKLRDDLYTDGIALTWEDFQKTRWLTISKMKFCQDFREITVTCFFAECRRSTHETVLFHQMIDHDPFARDRNIVFLLTFRWSLSSLGVHQICPLCYQDIKYWQQSSTSFLVSEGFGKSARKLALKGTITERPAG